MFNRRQASPDDERQLTEDEVDELVLRNGDRMEKQRIMEKRTQARKIGIGNTFGRR